MRDFVAAAWPALEQFGLADSASMDRLQFSADLNEALEGADFVQENGPERQDIKIETYSMMDKVLPADVILASSSSGLKISPIQGSCRHPERCVIGHPFNPPHLIPLVEVVGGESTSSEVVEQAMAFYNGLGKHAIHVHKEVPGHVANRLQAALWREVVHLVEDGVVSVDDVDAAVCWGPGLRWGAMGPVMLMHLGAGPEGGIGKMLKHLGPPVESWWKTLGNPTVHTPEVKEKLIHGAEEEAAGRSIKELEAERDRLLIGLLSLRNKGGKK